MSLNGAFPTTKTLSLRIKQLQEQNVSNVGIDIKAVLKK
jgi:hypothetical protein